MVWKYQGKKMNPKYMHILCPTDSRTTKKTTLFMPWNPVFFADHNIFPEGKE